MKECSHCGEKPTVISVPESEWYFCSITCLSKYTQSREDRIEDANRMFGYDEDGENISEEL